MCNPSQGWSHSGNDEKTDAAVKGGDEVGGTVRRYGWRGRLCWYYVKYHAKVSTFSPESNREILEIFKAETMKSLTLKIRSY